MMRPRGHRSSRSGRRRGGLGPVALLAAAVVAGGCASRPSPAAPEATEPALARALAEALATPAPHDLDGEPVDGAALRRLYEARRYAPLWIDDAGAALPRAAGVLTVLADAAGEGLDPRDYHADAIRRLLTAPGPGDAVTLELLLSDGVARYAVHQAGGVAPPRARDPAAARVAADPEVETAVGEVAAAADAGARLRAFAPAHAAYGGLRDALAFHRRLEAAGGWPIVPAAVLRPGATDAAVPLVRRRLAVSGDLGAEVSASPRYDDALVVAVRRFQWRHGIAPDGVVGPRTLAALNVPVAARLDAIVATMERWRWFGAELGARYVKVNVPDYSLVLVEDGVTVLAMPVVVGRTDWQTPVLRSHIRRVVFNPSWSIPPSIARAEILPKLRTDPGYLGRQGIVARDGVAGLRQAPGPRNPLGRVKFDMPNPLGIYLHDTPSRGAFARAQRTLSHGCIRLRDALLLADALLAGTPGWDDARRRALLATWRTRTVALAAPVPAYVHYETAGVDELGAVHFREDVYGRDPPLRRRMADAGRVPLAGRASGRRATARAPAGP